jgi:signal transduction histidine kinase
MLRLLNTKIALRLTVTVGLGLAVVISLVGMRIVLNEDHDLREAVRAEMLLLSRSVEIAFENAIRDKQLADVEETLEALEAIDGRIDIYVLGTSGRVVAQSKGQAHPPEVPRDGLVHFANAHGHELAVTHTALQGAIEGIDALVVVRPLDDMREDLSDTRAQVLITVLCSIAASALILFFGSRRFVGQPLEAMVQAMRRFRHDMSVELHGPYAPDEVGTALREFTALAEELRDARGHIEREQQARAELERHLLRADKLAVVGQLSAGLAHEVGSPLQVLGGRLQALKRELGGDEKAQRLLGIAIEQTDRITRVVQQLLSFGRPAPAMVRLVDPKPYVRDVVELLGLEAKRHGQSIEADFERAPAAVMVDPDHLSQIVLNLVRNALEASTNDNGHVRVVLEQERSEAGDVLALCVEDNGYGLDEAQKAKMFEPFFTTRGDRGGTGLGLAVVRTLAERYGGKAHVRSSTGKGTRVTVEIPINKPSPGEV